MIALLEKTFENGAEHTTDVEFFEGTFEEAKAAAGSRTSMLRVLGVTNKRIVAVSSAESVRRLRS